LDDDPEKLLSVGRRIIKEENMMHRKTIKKGGF
jgi:hypothetical protein